MTTIAATKDGDDVYIGCDSQVSTGWVAQSLNDPKLAKFNVDGSSELALGYTGRMQYGNVLQHRFTPPAHNRGDALAYIVRDFVPAVQEALRNAGFLKVRDEVMETDGQSIIAYRGRLFKLSAFDVVETASPFNAAGSGAEFAMGAMHASSKTGRDLVKAGLEAAAFFDSHTGSPFTIWKVKP